MPANRQDLRLAGIERGGNFVVIRDRCERLLIDFLDHVAFLQFGHAAIRIDAGTLSGLPLRTTSSSTFLFNSICATRLLSALIFFTSWPSNLRITSPFCNCAWAAGEPGITLLTI